MFFVAVPSFLLLFPSLKRGSAPIYSMRLNAGSHLSDSPEDKPRTEPGAREDLGAYHNRCQCPRVNFNKSNRFQHNIV